MSSNIHRLSSIYIDSVERLEHRCGSKVGVCSVQFAKMTRTTEWLRNYHVSIFFRVFQNVPSCQESESKLETRGQTRQDYLDPRKDILVHCLSCPSPMLAKFNEDARLVFTHNAVLFNIFQHLYHVVLWKDHAERTCQVHYLSCMQHHAALLKHNSKFVRWIFCIQSLHIFHYSLPAQWVDEYTLFVLDWTRGLSRDHSEYRPIQQASCSRPGASYCQSGRGRAQEATDTVYSLYLLIGVQISLTLCWKDSELLEYLYILTLLVLSLQFLAFRWDYLKTRGLSVPDPPEETDLHISDDVVTAISVSADASNSHADPGWPTNEQVSLCKRATPWFMWNVMPNCFQHRIEGTVLSRSASNYAWHYTQENFDDIRAYFHALEWSTEGKVSFLELFVDFFAYTGCHLSNPKAGRTRPLETAADFSASFAAALRAFPKVFQEQTPAHPAVACLVSHLTSFGMLKQAIGLSMRPRFRGPHAVQRFLCWSWAQPMKRTSWKWTLPLEHLRN